LKVTNFGEAVSVAMLLPEQQTQSGRLPERKSGRRRRQTTPPHLCQFDPTDIDLDHIARIYLLSAAEPADGASKKAARRSIEMEQPTGARSSPNSAIPAKAGTHCSVYRSFLARLRGRATVFEVKRFLDTIVFHL
jgi:hypothetical protein